MEDFRVKVDADSLWFFEGEEGLYADFSAECIGTEGGKDLQGDLRGLDAFGVSGYQRL